MEKRGAGTGNRGVLFPAFLGICAVPSMGRMAFLTERYRTPFAYARNVDPENK